MSSLSPHRYTIWAVAYQTKRIQEPSIIILAGFGSLSLLLLHIVGYIAAFSVP
jgi:hypothetical protein